MLAPFISIIVSSINTLVAPLGVTPETPFGVAVALILGAVINWIGIVVYSRLKQN